MPEHFHICSVCGKRYPCFNPNCSVLSDELDPDEWPVCDDCECEAASASYDL